MGYPPLSLIKRLVKGSKLSPAEMDGNLTDIETGVNAQAAQLAVALNPNGTLKNNSVSTAALQDRVVTLQKLAFLSSFYAEDTGAANAMVITFAPDPLLPAYVKGLVFYVKAIAGNTGATTLAVDGLAAKAVKVFTATGIGDPVATNIVAGNIYELIYDGTQFVMTNPTAPAPVLASSIYHFFTPVQIDSVVGSKAWTTYDASILVPAAQKPFAVMLQSYADADGGGSASQWETQVRKNSISDTYTLNKAIAGTNDHSSAMSQGIFPCNVAGAVTSIDYQFIHTGNVDSSNANITIIGYLA